MGILDDAIREHLELKRRHGATDDEVAKQEAEALGPARRQPAGDLDLEDDAAAGGAMAPPDPDDGASLLGDAPPPPSPLAPDPALEETSVFDEPLHAEPSPIDPLEPPPVAIEPEPDLSPEPEPEDEPVLPPEPEAVLPPEPEPEPDIALPPEPEDPLALPPDPGPDPYVPPDEPAGAAEPFDPPTEIARDDATRVRPTVPIHDDPSLPPEPALPPRREPDPEPEAQPPAPAGDGEDVLEETPDFLQDTPEHDRLWFEQKPPRDFDFDD